MNDTTPNRTGAEAGRSFLSSDLEIKGDIVAKGAIEIEGRVDGNITADSVLLGEGGVLTGDITAQTVDLQGRYTGNVKGGQVTVRRSAVVEAGITYADLVVESGARIVGKLSK